MLDKVLFSKKLYRLKNIRDISNNYYVYVYKDTNVCYWTNAIALTCMDVLRVCTEDILGTTYYIPRNTNIDCPTTCLVCEETDSNFYLRELYRLKLNDVYR